MTTSLVLSPHALSGSLEAISSKSDIHRLLICASLADTPSRIRFHAALSVDMCATMEVLRAMGAEFGIETNSDSGLITVRRPIRRNTPEGSLDCQESGSTARFLLPLASFLATGSVMTGHGRLPERPFDEQCRALEAMGAVFSSHTLPIRFEKAPLPQGDFMLRGDISSQYITGLLFLLPLCGASGIRLTTQLESAGYVRLTADAMRRFGVVVEQEKDRLWTTGTYHAPDTVIDAQGDWSNAAFWLAAATPGHPITLRGLDMHSSQPDRAIVSLLREMGMNIEESENGLTAIVQDTTKGISFDASGFPDLVPILSVRASVSHGETVISGTRRLRIKESDRVEAICRMLSALGGRVLADEDHIYIAGKPMLSGGTVDSMGDHRIAMAASIASVFCSEPVILQGAEAVSKSYPQFFEHFEQLKKPSGGTV